MNILSREKEIRYGLKKQDKGEKDKEEGKREQKGRGNENSVRDKRQAVSGEERVCCIYLESKGVFVL